MARNKPRKPRKTATTDAAKNSVKQPATAGFFRRLGAWFYDVLIIIALELIATGLIVALLQAIDAMGMLHLDQYGYIDYSDFMVRQPIIRPLYTIYCAAIWIGFFVYFWKKGQTLGMRAWKIAVVDDKTGGPITVTQALIRLFTSAFGLSNLSVPIDPKKRAFHDIWAKTRVIETD